MSYRTACLAALFMAIAGTSSFAAAPGTARDPRVAQLAQEAQAAANRGDLATAVLQLKNALRIAPADSALRLQLGRSLMAQGNAIEAERELRQARADGAPVDQVLPSLYDAMLARDDRVQTLLEQFPEPPAADRSPQAAVTLRARALAYRKLGQREDALRAIDRAIAIQRNNTNVLTRATFAQEQGDAAMANTLIDEVLSRNPSDASALITKISLLQQAGQFQQALTYADRLIQLNPEAVATRFVRIGLLIRLNQDARAKADVDFALSKTPRLPIGIYYRAVLLARAGDRQGAWNIAQILPLEFAREQLPPGLALAQMAMDSGNLEPAATILSTLMVKFPNDPETRIRLAALRLLQNSPQRALDVLLPLKDKNLPRAHVLLGQAYIGLRQYAEATEYFEKATEAGFSSDTIRTELALTRLESGEVQQGVQDLVDLSETNTAEPGTAGPLIIALLQNRKFAEAMDLADRLAMNAPQNPLGQFYRGQILIQQGSLDMAVTAFDAALKLDPNFVPALYYRAQVRAERGDLTGANADLDTVIARDPKNALALIKKGQLAARAGAHDQALTLFQRAVATQPTNLTPTFTLASYYVSRDRDEDAIAAANAFLQRAPNNNDALALVGQIQFTSGKQVEAARTFRRLVAVAPNSPAAHLMLGDSLAAANDSVGAISAYRKAAELEPRSLAPRSSLVNHALKRNDANGALNAAREYATAYPSTDADLLMANTLIRLKRADEAKASLTRSLATRPDGRVVLSLAQVTRDGGDPKGAQTLLANWIKNHPDDLSVVLTYGSDLLRAGETAAAKTQFETAVRLDPYNAAALNNLAWLIRTEDPQRAIRLATLASRIAPRSGEILDTLAWMKWEQNDRRDVLPMLTRARELSRNNPEIALHFAIALEAAGRRDEAKQTLSELLASGQSFSGLEQARALAAQWR